jgi:hypothetical protein
MSRESEPKRRRRSKPVKEQSFPISKFGKCVIALEPVKPALWLAQRIPCTERHANHLISGRSRPSGRALVVILDEID